MRTERDGVKAGKELYGVLARYTNSEALTIVKSVSEMDGVRAWARLRCELQQKNVGANVQSATRVHVSEALRRMLVKCDWQIMQWEEKWKVMMSELGEGCENPRSMENVGVAGDFVQRTSR